MPPHVVCLDTPSGPSDNNSFLPREFGDRAQKDISQRVCDKFVTYMHAINEEEYSSPHDVQRMTTEEIEMMNNNWVFLQSKQPKPRVVWDYSVNAAYHNSVADDFARLDQATCLAQYGLTLVAGPDWAQWFQMGWIRRAL